VTFGGHKLNAHVVGLVALLVAFVLVSLAVALLRRLGKG
jgi:hypothetical protein